MVQPEHISSMSRNKQIPLDYDNLPHTVNVVGASYSSGLGGNPLLYQKTVASDAESEIRKVLRESNIPNATSVLQKCKDQKVSLIIP